MKNPKENQSRRAHPAPAAVSWLFEDSLEPGRGDQAARNLMEAGAEIFGLKSLEGARVREIADAAGQNIGAISYYFGGKEGLYDAVIRAIIRYMKRRVEPGVVAARRFLDGKEHEPEKAMECMRFMLDLFLDAVVGEESTLAASLIIMREQTRPTAAFEMVYSEIIEPVQTLLVRLLSVAFGWNEKEDLTIVQSHLIIGLVFGFRSAREAVIRMTKWQAIEKEQTDTIRRAIHMNLDALAQRYLQDK